MAEERSGVQLIDEKGIFHATRFNNFGKDVKMDKWGSYNVVSVMDLQDSDFMFATTGTERSTLLNDLFDTKFGVMDASIRSNFEDPLLSKKQAARGIRVAKSGNIPCTLVMDMEGSDSRNRGENDTKFGNWSTLFAIAISDFVLIEMSVHDIGREGAAIIPLLSTVLKFMQCRPLPNVTLMLVLCDQFTIPLELLRKHILEDMKQICNSADSSKKLEEFFNFDGQLKVEALCSRFKKNEFKKQVAELKEKICGVVREKRNVVPASDFSENAKRIWEKINDIKDDLSIPSIKVLVAKIYCDRIANEKFQRFKRDYEAKPLSSLLETCLSEYDEETLYYDKVTRSEKRKKLEAEMRQLQVEQGGTGYGCSKCCWSA